jgi:hypothetical protein
VRHRVSIVVFLLLAAIMLIAGEARSADTISGKVTKLADGTPLQGATVTVAGPQQPPLTQTTGADGTFSIDVPGSGPCTVGISAGGFKAKALTGATGGSLDPIALAPATYSPLPVYAGSGQVVRADAHTGIFYTLTGIDVYRTLDYGGSWQLATMSWDDPQSGLQNPGSNIMAVSGVSGEVAIAPDGAQAIRFSTDYGLSWRTVGGDYHPAPRLDLIVQLFWAHAAPNAANVLLAVQPADDGSGSWNVWRADMSAASPAFVKEPSDPFGSGSVIAVADSAGGSFVGRVSASGSLSFAPLTASGPVTFGPEEAVALPAPPLMLRLGGVKEASAPPDGALIVGGSAPYQAVMLAKDAGATSFAGATRSLATNLPDPSGVINGAVVAGGSVMPTSTGTSGAGNAGGCSLKMSGSGSALTIVNGPEGIAEGKDLAYDAGYGQSGDLVAINGRTSTGPWKYARLNADGLPATEQSVASAGTGSGSGGHSIVGITSPSVNDTAYGPAAGDVAVAAMHVAMASKDGGKTMTEVLPRVGRMSHAVQWWQGASGDWLLFGFGGPTGNMLSALHNWDGATTLAEPNVIGSTCTELGGPPQGWWTTGMYVAGALAPIPGTDSVFIGLGTWGEEKYGAINHVYRAHLTATDPPKLEDLTSLDPAPAVATLYSPLAMAYCPDDPSVPEAMRDVLFVATGQYGSANPVPKGSLLRITGASTSSPSVTVVGSIPHDSDNTVLSDVRVDYRRGVVYAGGEGQPSNQTGPGLYKSVDGGQTFTRLTILGPDGAPALERPGVTAIGLNPADPNDVTVATGAVVYHSADGGASWTLVRDPSVERPSMVSDIEFAPGASSPSIPRAGAARAAAAPPKLALVGTDSGVYDGDLGGGQRSDRHECNGQWLRGGGGAHHDTRLRRLALAGRGPRNAGALDCLPAA